MKRLLAATETTAAFFLLLIALLTASNVFVRYVFGFQIPDWFDGASMLQAIALSWGFALATYYGSHICVDLFWELSSPATKRRIDLFATALTLVFSTAMAWMMWVKSLNTGGQTTMDLLLPLDWFFIPASFGLSVGAVLCALRLVKLWRGEAEDLMPEEMA